MFACNDTVILSAAKKPRLRAWRHGWTWGSFAPPRMTAQIKPMR